MYDLVIHHARICDGTGKPSFIGTLGVTDGRITYLGRDTGLTAQRTIDADGLVLAPEFIDPHTHYDAQIAWDPLLTSSPWHGVTTAVPAALFGIPNRGTLAEGKVADLVLFDPATVTAKAPEYVHDFPRHGRRLIARAEGIVGTFVAGTQVYDHSSHTGALPGRILRSYE